MQMTNLSYETETVWLLTVTAPGADVLPCSAETCGSKGPHKQRSADGCRIDDQAADDWNSTAQKRWSELHRKARQTIRRQGYDLVVLDRVWQMHARGVYHLHLVVRFGIGPDRAAAWAYVRELRRLSRAHQFGNVDARDRDGRAGKSTVMEGWRAGWYLSRYLSESPQFAAAIARPIGKRPRRLVWINPQLTKATGCTMRRLRRVRYLWWIRQGKSTVVHAAGQLPAWFRDPIELQHVLALSRAP